MTVGELLVLEPTVDEERRLTSLELFRVAEYTGTRTRETGTCQNLLFVPVSPDWRDSKSLLGYYNPLTSTYEWTDFLRFLQRAERSYRDGDGLAWFVILDEMNLAHVEYYFADLLSVLESGRIEDGEMRGMTREPLRFTYPEDAEGDLPPRELRLPPNLYVVGTVNVDETTHAFSPKVLDRAFTLEFTDVDFADYPPQFNGDATTGDADTARQLLTAFTQDGTFERVDKGTIAAFVADHPEVRDHLQSLNNLLKPHDMHFGYRVFDEIVTFLSAADQNDMFVDEEGDDPALDAAVLMKVLPKFHGSRGKLEAPLRAVLAWCLNPEIPDRVRIDGALAKIEDADHATASLKGLPFAHPRTAARTIRMLRALYTDGFTAFG
jgi:5-methylcytosine-specific restriction endonuclease McrBC GTP-binding regulatory subunit McrB